MAKAIVGTSLGGLPLQLSLTTRDYAAIREEVLKLVSVLTPEWTDFYPADPGVALLESVAYVADILSYYLDRIQNEAYLPTAQLRRSVILLLRLIGYELSPGSAATVGLQITTSDAVVIPAGSVFSSVASPSTPAVEFELLDAVTLSGAGTHLVDAGGLPIVAVHGRTISQEILGTSSGAPSQKFLLKSSPLALNPDGSSPLRIEVFSGVVWETWTEVRTFLESEPDSQVYRYEINDEDRITIIFGDGINGQIPPAGIVNGIRAMYRVGGGSSANSVGAGTIKKIVSAPAQVTAVTNPLQPSGGKGKETIEHAKKYGPLTLRSMDRCVTAEDYAIEAKKIAGVAAAKAHNPDAFTVEVIVAAEGSNPMPTGKWFPQLEAGSGLLGAVGRHLNSRRTVPSKMKVVAPTVVRPHLRGTVKVLPNVLQSEVRGVVGTKLKEFFLGYASNFGVTIPLSEVYSVFEATQGVDYVDLIEFHRNPTPRLLSGKESAYDHHTLSVSNVGSNCYEEAFEVRWLTPASFRMLGSVRGVVTDATFHPRTFLVDTQYDIVRYNLGDDPELPDAAHQFTFSISWDGAAQTRPNAGDRWELRVDDAIGNINLAFYELMAPTLTALGELSPVEFILGYTGGIA